MAVTRPLKEGSVTTYQAKVALGFPDILASEMDADLDTIYAAWNGGVNTANLVDGSVTTPKLATAPNGVGTTNLNDLAVTTAKLAAGAAIRGTQVAALPGNFAGTATAWAPVLTMPNITTRGGVVLAVASGGWSSKAPPNTDVQVQLRWIRNPGAVVLNTVLLAYNAGSSTLPTVPLPVLVSLEQPAAGTWTYVVQYQLAGASYLTTPAGGAGLCWLVEFA